MKNLMQSLSSSSSSGWHRFLTFCGIYLLCLVIFIGILHAAFAYGAGLVLLYIPLGIALVSLLGPAVWLYRYKNGFESFLVYITLCASLLTFLIMAPLVVERSLSCFLYFKAVEDGSVAQEAISPDFITSFVQKRFDDGVKGGFLTRQDNTYLPTPRSKLFYGIYYPLGFLTNTLDNYHQFKASYENKDK
ncbi:MAG: hypothetical protein SPL08_03370 [Pseudomonadota bacterium]|nr:hypothetical protein [Pseudomonadota bacterium]